MARLIVTAKGANTGRQTPAWDDVEERIIRRTYELYEQQGRKDRRYVEHWVQAMRELAAGDRGNQPTEEINNQAKKETKLWNLKAKLQS